MADCNCTEFAVVSISQICRRRGVMILLHFVDGVDSGDRKLLEFILLRIVEEIVFTSDTKIQSLPEVEEAKEMRVLTVRKEQS